MKRLILLLAAATALTACRNEGPAAPASTDRENDNLKGRVRSVETTEYRLTSGEEGEVRSESDRTPRFLTRYDEEGYSTGLLIASPDGEIVSQVPIRNEQNQRIEEKLYDGENNLIGSVGYTYDRQGHRLEQRYYDEEGQLTARTANKNDRSGRIVEVEGYDWDGTLYTRFVNEYDDRDMLSRQRQFIYTSAAFTGSQEETHEYDTRFEYDEGGLLLRSTVRSESLVPPEITRTNTYEFDSQGNWIVCRTVTSAGEATLTERKIEYYP